MNHLYLLRIIVGLGMLISFTLPVSAAQPPILPASGPDPSFSPSPPVSADWWAAARPHILAGEQGPDGISPVPTWSADSDQAGAWFGVSVSSAGDVDDDGYDDVIVGAWYYDAGATDSGRAYLFYGSEQGLSTTPGWIADPPYINTYGFFGVVVGTAGDVNGDGYDDIMVAMTNYDYTSSDEGAIFVWYGSETGPGSTYDWFARGDALYAHLGWDCGTAGDIDGDGYDDIIAGAYRYDQATVSHAYVWLGSGTGLGADGVPSNADWTATSDQPLSAFGTHVGSAGDVNGDGYGDVFVGAPEYSNTENDEGMVFVWHGSATGLGVSGEPSNADWAAESDQTDAQLSGTWSSSPQEGCVGTAGDVNGDGYGDFMAGSNVYNTPETNAGALFLWYGSATGLGEQGNPSNADWYALGDQANTLFSSAAGTAGDVNGDGYDDVVVGGRSFSQGLAAAWFGSETGLGEYGTPGNADWSVDSGQSGSQFGYALATAGDVNGDGLADIIVGAPLYDDPEVDEGAAFAYYGQPDPITGLTASNDSPTRLGETTTLTATITTGTSISYTWAFGDGLTGYGDQVTHDYADTGAYTAVVTASNTISVAVASTVVTVEEAIDGLTAANDGPTAVGALTTLTASVTAGSNVAYAWDFGDGAYGSGQIAAHTYPATGSYVAVVTATNAISGATAQTTVTIEARIYLPLIFRG
ncbi:MAG: PKD domain-containing protein [Anaerolineae bacterium]|jgi:hypothetical protein